MDIILKQRLVGAIVLISLGVIFIPMLLSGKGELSSPILKSNIPPTPKYDIKKPDVVMMRTVTVPVMVAGEQGESGNDSDEQTGDDTQAEPVTSETETPSLPVTQGASPDKDPVKIQAPVHETPKQTIRAATIPAKTAPTKSDPIKTDATKTDATKTVTQKIQPASVPVTRPVLNPVTGVNQAKPQTTQTKTVPTAATNRTENAASAQVVPAGTITSWVVQVGSFAQRNNANTLRDRLRKNGFASFVEPRSGSGETVYRVRVGPELKRSMAEDLLEKLQQKEKLTGIVMSYPRQ